MGNIVVNHVSKRFYLGKKRQTSLEAALMIFSPVKSEKEFAVLQNISFNIESGTRLGVIGRNGSGKSTLLRVIAGIYGYEKGNVSICGDVIFLSSFNNGIRPKLTMRENIYLSATILGLKKYQIDAIFANIIGFSGLHDFVDVAVAKFSSGMVARLAFSITFNAIQVLKPTVLLLDEVFSAGADLSFRNKGMKAITELINTGVTVVLVSHSLDIIQKYCDQALWLEQGKIIKHGAPQEVVKAYTEGFDGA